MTVAAVRNRVIRLEEVFAEWDSKRPDPFELLRRRAERVYGQSEAYERVVTRLDDPEVVRDLVIDDLWPNLALDSPGGTLAESWEEISRRVHVYKADRDWPEDRGGLRDFLGLRRHGRTDAELLRDFLLADDDQEEDDGPGLHGPLLLWGKRFPVSLEEALWLAAQGDGLYLLQVGLDPACKQVVRARKGQVFSRGFGEPWTFAGAL
jgi:hypothetical protein